MIKSIGKNQHPKTLHNYYNLKKITYVWKGFPGDSVIKNPPAVQETEETWVPSLGGEDLLEKEMATHSSILAWKIPWTEEPDGPQSRGLQRVRHD